MNRFILICIAAGLLIGCDSSPSDRRQTQAVRAPMSGELSTEREVHQDDSMDMSLIQIDAPKNKNDTIHVLPFGAKALDLFPSTAPAGPENGPQKSIDAPQGTINLKPSGTPPPASKQ